MIQELQRLAIQTHRKPAEVEDVVQEIHGLLVSPEILEPYVDWERNHSRELAQSIAFQCYNLGRLSVNFSGRISIRVEAIGFLLCRLINVGDSIPCKAIANALHGGGQLAKNECLAGCLSVDVLNHLLNELGIQPRVTALSISNAMSAIGYMAMGRNLSGDIGSRLLQDLLVKLAGCPDVNAQAIANSLIRLGYLAQDGYLLEALDAKIIGPLLVHLELRLVLEAQNISQSISGIGLLVKFEKLQLTPVLREVLSRLFTKALSMELNATYTGQLLDGVMGLSMKLPVRDVQRLMKCCLDSHRYTIEPSKAAAYVHYLVQHYREEHAPLDEVFQNVLARLIGTIDNYPPRLKQQLEEDLEQLANVDDWRDLLSQSLYSALSEETGAVGADRDDGFFGEVDIAESMETLQPRQPMLEARGNGKSLFEAVSPASPVLEKKQMQVATTLLPDFVDERIRDESADPIYRALSTGIIADLEALFHRRSQPVGAIHRALETSAARREHRAGGARGVRVSAVGSDSNGDRTVADEMVEHFLLMSDGQALRKLIRRLQASSFDLMLGACSQHRRYQLAIQQALHPVMIHLPIQELQSMTKSLISRGFYVDHQALIKLVNALAVRLILHRDLTAAEKQLIFECQTKLLEEGLKHHARHCRVLPRLQSMKCNVDAKRLVFADEEDGRERALPQASEVRPTSRSAEMSLAGEAPPRCLGRAEALTPVGLLSRGEVSSSVVRGTLFGEGARRSGSSRDVHMDYLYEAEDVNAILHARIQDDDVLILSAANMGAGMVGIILESDADRRLTVSYYSSYKEDHFNNRALIEEIWQSLIASEVLKEQCSSVTLNICERSLKQRDQVSCGVYLVENLYSGIKSCWWDPLRVEHTQWTRSMRQKHLELLNEYNPSLYAQCVDRQRHMGEARQQERSHTRR